MRFFTLLILLSIVPLGFMLVPWISGQNYTTFTTVNQLTGTNTVSSAVASYTNTITQQTAIVTGLTSIVRTSFGCYAIYWGPFNAYQGQTVTGTISTGAPLSLSAYILSDKQFMIWYNSGLGKGVSYCDPADSGATSDWQPSQQRFTRTDVSWTPGSDGKYYFSR
jgi:hypothetical protein